MKSDFLLAITQLAAEKNLPREVVLTAVEAALVSAYRKEPFATNQNISVKINLGTGRVEVWVEKLVVEQPQDSHSEITLAEAQKIVPEVQLGDSIKVEATPHDAGRIAAQTAKQVILQRLHEAEHSAIFEEYTDKEGDIITGVVQRIELRQVFIDLGKTEAILPASEQVRIEKYRVGQRLKVCILEVARTNKGPRVVVSRSHPDLLRRLFELEIPEVYNGVVEIKALAREAGSRSKVAVAARQEGIDPVGCCVGLRGIRIQNIVNELNGEKIDVVMWNPDATLFIANALSPAQVVNVKLDQGEEIATVVIPDRQLSLAIGRAGQNVRLAAKLTGWHIDIKSATEAEAEKLMVPEPSAEAKEEVQIPEELPVETPEVLEPALVPADTVEEKAESVAAVEGEVATEEVAFVPVAEEAKAELRFAEDILRPSVASAGAKAKKKKKKTARDKEVDKEEVKPRKRRKTLEVFEEEEY